MFHSVGKLYFNSPHLILKRCGDIIDRAPSIGPTDDVSSVAKKQVLLEKSSVKLAKSCPIDHGGRCCPTATMVSRTRRCHIQQSANMLVDC
jgi:hypothetical protein